MHFVAAGLHKIIAETKMVSDKNTRSYEPKRTRLPGHLAKINVGNGP